MSGAGLPVVTALKLEPGALAATRHPTTQKVREFWVTSGSGGAGGAAPALSVGKCPLLCAFCSHLHLSQSLLYLFYKEENSYGGHSGPDSQFSAVDVSVQILVLYYPLGDL